MTCVWRSSWVPPGGGENAVIKDRLGPKQSFGSNTFLGHVFEATDFVNKKPVSRFEVVDEVKMCANPCIINHCPWSW